MRLADCYTLLELSPGATLDEIKASYRKLAFKYHPDLHPGDARAAARFARLNEAYVLLKKQQDSGSFSTGARTYDAETIRQEEEAKVKSGSNRRKPSAFFTRQEEVLKDILNDPFAKQVFEDIFSKLRRGVDLEDTGASRTWTANKENSRIGQASHGQYFPRPAVSANWLDSVKNWAARQLDDHQTVHLPARSLVPGTVLQVQIRHRFQAKPRVVELALPGDFIPGQAIRLKGLGRKLGPWQGDLYLRFLPNASTK